MEKNVHWEKVQGYEDYLVNTLGQVWSLKSSVPHMLAPSMGSGHYYQVILSRIVGGKSETKTFRIHRLVAEAFIPNPEKKEQVDHIDGNGFNNEVDNLRWVTAIENVNNPRTKIKNLVAMHQYWEENRVTKGRRWKVMAQGEWIDEKGEYHYDPECA